MHVPLLISRPLIVLVVVDAVITPHVTVFVPNANAPDDVIAPKLTLPVVMIALHVAVKGAPTVSVCMFVPVVPVTVNVFAPLLIDGAVIAPHVTVFVPNANAPVDVIAPHPSVPMPDTLPDDPIVIVFRVVTPDTAPELISRPLIVLVVVDAVITPHVTVFVPNANAPDDVIAPKLTLPVVMIALHVDVAGAPTVSVFMLEPVVPVTVNVLAPLLIDDAVIVPVNSVTPPIELFPFPVTMTPLALLPLTFSVSPFHVSPEFALIVPGLPDVVIR